MDRKFPEISILLPVYNEYVHLDACLSNLGASTYPNFEICIVDDGSTDGSLDKLYQWAERDRRIRIKSRSNKGIAETRNELMDMARGDLMILQDTDDLSHTSRLDIIARSFQAHRWDLFHSRVFLINELNEIRGASFVLRPFSYFMQCGHNSIIHGSVAIRKGALQSVGKYRDVPAEDFELWLRCLREPLKLHYCAEPIYAYRIHRESLTGGNTKKISESSDLLATRISPIPIKNNFSNYINLKVEIIYGDLPAIRAFLFNPLWSLRIYLVRMLQRYFARRYRRLTMGFDTLVWKS